MSVDADGTITALRAHFGVQTDADLAKKLRVDKSTVYSWRSRGSVPVRFTRILEGGSNQLALTPPMHWGEHEKAAFEVALFRFSRIYKDSENLTNYRSSFQFFSGKAYVEFLILMNDAQADLLRAAEDGSTGIREARSLLIFDDLEAGHAAVERDRSRIAQVYSVSDE